MATNTPYGNVGLALANKEIDWSADTVRMMLVTGYTFNKDTHIYLDDGPRASEVANGNGYTTDGAALSTKTETYDSTNDRVEFSSAAVTWSASSISATGAVLYVDTGTDSTSALICYIDFEGTETSVSADFTITPNADGWFYIST